MELKKTALFVMALDLAKLAVEMTTTAKSVKVQEIASSATGLGLKANIMSEQGEPNIEEQSRVTRLLDMRKEQLNLAEQAEFHLMTALWDLRGSYSLEDMVRWTGWSRQTIYNKWDKHGLSKRSEDAKPTGD